MAPDHARIDELERDLGMQGMSASDAIERTAALRAEQEAAEARRRGVSETQSFDEFWASVAETQETETILGITVPVPSPATITLQAQRGMQERDLTDVSDAQLAAAIDELFGAGAFERWVDAGMTLRQLGVVMAWGYAAAGGNRVSWAEAHEAITRGKAPARLVKERALAAKTGGSTAPSASTGGPSKPRSQRSTRRRRRR